MKKLPVILLLVCALLTAGCQAPADAEPDYSSTGSWVYLQTVGGPKEADVFFVCPTVYFGAEGEYNMPLEDAAARDAFDGAVNMQVDIYDENARFFAPYYRQAGLNVYEMMPAEREQYLELAFEDVLSAFDYYLENLNDGRPIILAGFSQGADMCLRLMKERFNDAAMRDKLIACYAIGWSISEEELGRYPELKFAQDNDDYGVIVSFNTEAEHVEDSLIVPEGTRTLAINPLNWRTDTAVADKSLNDGACFPDSDGRIVNEIDQFTGAYIDSDRGTLKVTDVNEAAYPPQLDIFDDGVYHVYDYQFFYRDLQENVRERTQAYLS